MRIDAHQHFWQLTRFSYPWMPEGESVLRRDYLPEDLAPILEEHRFDGSIAVQATTDPGEAQWLLDLATANRFIKGAVVWTDLTSPALPHELDRFQQHSKFKGIRHPVHDEPEERWLLRDDVISGLTELARRGIPYDLLLRPIHLPLIPRIAERVPNLRMVIDHLAKPRIAARDMEGWARSLSEAANLPQVF
jgi:L-fuconolactonase